jgi:hypothetical protein
MIKTKRNTYKGIPAKNRAQVARVIETGAFAMLPGASRTPQKVWAALQESWVAKKREDQAQEVANKKMRAKRIKTRAAEAFKPALNKLAEAHDLTIWIAAGDSTYLETDTWARFAGLAIAEAGKELEQALCDLGLVEESDAGYFVYDLKREGVKKPAQEAAK